MERYRETIPIKTKKKPSRNKYKKQLKLIVCLMDAVAGNSE